MPTIHFKLLAVLHTLRDYDLLNTTHIDIASSGWSDQLFLTAEWKDLTDTERTNFKRMFDTEFAVRDSYAGKDLQAKREFEFDFDGGVETAELLTFNGTISTAYECKTLTPQEVVDLSENEREQIWEQAKSGVIKFQQCTPVANKEE